MAKQPKHLLEDNPFIEGLFDWMDSPEGQLSDEAREIVWTLLEKADVDAKSRQIIWDDGKRRSITESAQHIHADYPDWPLELIESKVITWLEMDFAPETYSPEQLDELDRLTEKWIEGHERQAKKGKKPGRKSPLLST
jgi:hypothetical protein